MVKASLILLALFAVCFLLGSIPWGLVISKVFYKTDIRQHGSGNIGTTNAMRTLGKVGGSVVFVLDFAKGIASGLIALGVANFLVSENPVTGLPWITPLMTAVTGDKMLAMDLSTLDTAEGICLSVAFLGCIWGHIFTPWLGFKGGKGIAVAVGCLFSTFGPVGACLELAIFIVLVLATRYVSVGSIAAAVACPFFALYYFWGNPFAIALCTLAAATVVWAHRGNIERLRKGTESRVGSKKKA
ncbi:MAG: glycerol-3-phosphate 1-O-acyltransferase PlsY [Eggerthellaceae bacterium]|nr:glycerol-3-phosphate 1-O-acyltransferase PlsY [Eggerthellaceae bacterium]